jgi:hypothetical protein
MKRLLPLVLLLAAAPARADEKPTPLARVTLTAELACMHCTFGEGESCAVCLKLDAKTPVLLAGKVAKQFEEDRLSRKVVVLEGTLSLSKDKRLLLTSDKGEFLPEKDAAKYPAKGTIRVEGKPCCGMCDLMVCDECTLAVKNGAAPIVLDGKLAREHPEGKEKQKAAVEGRPFVDKRGLLRLEATKVQLSEK